MIHLWRPKELTTGALLSMQQNLLVSQWEDGVIPPDTVTAFLAFQNYFTTPCWRKA